jgi:hypothetical protein
MKIIQYIDRILWATRVASHTTPTYVGDYMPHGESGASDASRRDAASDRDGLPLVRA